MTGVLLAVPPVDFVLHNSTFLVAHFHNVIIGGVLFGMLAGYNYWFPKVFGFTLDERWGKASFWCWLVGFYLAFMPLYWLGMIGMTRRLQHIPDPAWQPLAAGRRGRRDRHLLRHPVPDRAARRQHPHARAAPRPDRRPVGREDAGMGDRVAAAALQFRGIAAGRDDRRLLGDEAARAGRGRRGLAGGEARYEPIEMPRNTPIGFVLSFFAVVTGFALIWQIWWMAVARPARRLCHDPGVRLERRPRTGALGRRRGADRTGPAGPEASRMTITTTLDAPPTELVRGHGGGGPAPTRTVVAYGFWIFILSDIIMFSGLFAAYAVLSGNTAGGPTGRELFNLRNVFIETMCLLVSSYTCGLAALSAERRRTGRVFLFFLLTFALGAAFLYIEINEFAGMVREGAGPSRSAFLSAFFTLVGMHGAHVTAGLIWLVYMAAQVAAKGLRQPVLQRVLCWSLFWHALDIIWVGVLTLVYLMGAR